MLTFRPMIHMIMSFTFSVPADATLMVKIRGFQLGDRFTLSSENLCSLWQINVLPLTLGTPTGHYLKPFWNRVTYCSSNISDSIG